jgi:hypothetical protein
MKVYLMSAGLLMGMLNLDSKTGRMTGIEGGAAVTGGETSSWLSSEWIEL